MLYAIPLDSELFIIVDWSSSIMEEEDVKKGTTNKTTTDF
jgi:hypothetical protein